MTDISRIDEHRTRKSSAFKILVEPGDGGSGTTVNLPEEWRVSAPFQIRSR